jgi:hypothetical protein
MSHLIVRSEITWNYVGHKMFCVSFILTRLILEDIETGHDHFQVRTRSLIDHFFIHVLSGLQIHYILPAIQSAQNYTVAFPALDILQSCSYP